MKNISSAPLVTIITPAYNREELIAETIESVLAQDYPNIEYIVLDDGSEDRTLEVIKRYSSRLHWSSHPNMGEALTVNKGFGMGHGEILGVVNSDDPLLPGAVTCIVRALLDKPTAIVAYPDWKVIDKLGKTLQEIRCHDFVSHVDMLKRHYCLPGPGAFFWRKAIDETHGRDPDFRYVGDLDFWFRIGFLGSFVRVPVVLATFRVHEKSASVFCRSLCMAQEHILVIKKFFDNKNMPGNLLKAKRECFLNAYHAAVCFSGKANRLFKIKYAFKSLSCDPFKFLFFYNYRILIYLLIIFGYDYNDLYYRLIKIKKYYRQYQKWLFGKCFPV